MYLVKEIAKIAGVSVRTLHHYDQKALLKPDKIDPNGYRKYSDESLSRLQHILFLKELDFSLVEIGKILQAPDFNRTEALLKQKELLKHKRDRLNNIIDTLDKTITSLKDGTTMNKKKMFNSFNMDEIKKAENRYMEEVKQKYGSSDSYKESVKRTSGYGEKDWKLIKRESDEIMNTLVSLMDKEISDKTVQISIKNWQDHITKYYYECSKKILLGLGEAYVDDIRFTKNIDKHGQGFSIFFRDAIRYYCNNCK